MQPRPSLTYGYMKVHLDREAEEVKDQVIYLYKYELRCSLNAPLINN